MGLQKHQALTTFNASCLQPHYTEQTSLESLLKGIVDERATS